MGLRQGGYVTVWEVKPKTQAITQLRVSSSKKDRTTDEYVTDFSGYISVLGSEVASRAMSLKSGDRIRLGAWELTNKYNKEKGETYWNVAVYEFENADNNNATTNSTAPAKQVDDGEVDNDDLPF